MKKGSKLGFKQKDGTVLFGYSQTSLDKNTRTLRIVAAILGTILLYILWLTYYVIRHNVVNNIVANRCI